MLVAGLNVSELLELAGLLVVVGALAGFLAGVFGIGGGAILVPVFYECFRLAGVPLEVRMPLCIGTSLAIIIPTSISSFRAHYLRGAVDMAVLRLWAVPVISGVILGSVIARYAPERLFKYRVCRGGVVGRDTAAVRPRFVAARRHAAERFPDESLRRPGRAALDPDGRRRRAVFQSADDVLRPADPSGGGDLVGIGGADLDPRRDRLCLCRLARGGALPGCHRAAIAVRARLRLADRRGAGDADHACWPAAARYPDITALQLPFAIGYVSLIGAVLVIPTSLLTAPLGVRAAHAMSKRTLEMAFGCYLFIVGSRFVISLL